MAKGTLAALSEVDPEGYARTYRLFARADGGRRLFVRHDYAERQSARQRLGGDENVWRNRGLGELISEVGAGAADATLDLIENQKRVMPVGQLARLAAVLGRDGEDAAFALDPLDDDAGGAVAHRALERRRIGLRDESNALEQRLEILPVLGLAGDR